MLNVKNERIKLGQSNVSNVDFKQEFAYWVALSNFQLIFLELTFVIHIYIPFKKRNNFAFSITKMNKQTVLL